MTTQCIKCHASYEESQEEAYLCPPCLEVHKAQAAIKDARHVREEWSEDSKLPLEERLKKLAGPGGFHKMGHY